MLSAYSAEVENIDTPWVAAQRAFYAVDDPTKDGCVERTVEEEHGWLSGQFIVNRIHADRLDGAAALGAAPIRPNVLDGDLVQFRENSTPITCVNG